MFVLSKTADLCSCLCFGQNGPADFGAHHTIVLDLNAGILGHEGPRDRDRCFLCQKPRIPHHASLFSGGVHKRLIGRLCWRKKPKR